MRATVVILTKLPGHLPIKTRLHPLLGRQGAEAFYRESLERTIALALRFCDRPILATSPEQIDPRPALPGLDGCDLVPVAGDDGATCLENALSAASDGRPLVALGGDAPDLPAARVEAALACLADHHAAFVPTPDGGFSCLVLRGPVEGLAAGFEYGGANALESLEAWFAARGLATARVEPWPDVDTPEDYEAFRKRDAGA